ncbi:MAG: 50S ribosomal protein L24 [Lentimicrobiaceae bacterium]|nr:50S ribosomal protein L24 [Lentimicrobiaceae bacterium]
MSTKLKIKKGDIVKVITGESKGKQGKVLEVMLDKQQAIVEGANLISKHTRPNAQNAQGGIVKKEAGIHLSNLMVIDNTGKPARVGRKLDAKTNKLVRYSKKSGEVIK